MVGGLLLALLTSALPVDRLAQPLAADVPPAQVLGLNGRSLALQNLPVVGYLGDPGEARSQGDAGAKATSAAVDIAKRIVADPQRYWGEYWRLRPFVGDDRVIEAVIAAAKDSPLDKQQVLVDVITELGSSRFDPDQPATPQYRFIESGRVVDYLVGLLNRPEGRLRSKAADILITRVRPSDIQSRAARIRAVIGPTGGVEYVILGTTRDRRAREALPKPADVEKVLLPWRQLAAAMLGDSTAEEQIIDRFRKTQSPQERNESAMALARIGSTNALTALAGGLRSPHVAKWGGTGKQSFRLVVIASLSWAYPEEKILWKPRTPPTSDKYYEAIERWAEKHFEIRWDRPRPPFMYQNYAPMFPRIQQSSVNGWPSVRPGDRREGNHGPSRETRADVGGRPGRDAR